MKSFLITTIFFVGLFFTAGTALSYDCYERTPPPPRPQPCACSQCQKVQYKQKQPCSSRCDRCDRTACSNPFRYTQCGCDRTVVRNDCGKKKVKPRQTYQCQTSYTEKTERITTVRCDLCGTRYLKGVHHRCNRVQDDRCGKKQPVNVVYQCDTKRCGTCGKQYRQERKHHCGTRYQSYQCDDRYDGYNCRTKSRKPDCFRESPCRQKDCRCATINCDDNPDETMETRWRKWFKMQEQRI